MSWHLFTDPSGEMSLSEIGASIRALGTLVRLSLPTLRTTGTRTIKAPKIAVYKGQKRKGVKLRPGGLRFVPHYFVYIEAIFYTPGFGLRTGFTYDIGGDNAEDLFNAVKLGNVSAIMSGSLEKNRASRTTIFAEGGRIDAKPAALFSYMHFLIWETAAYKPFTDGFNYCVIGTNCASWTLMALTEARAISRLPIYP